MLFRNSGNTSWSPVSGDLTGGPHLGNSGQVNGTLTSVSVSPVDSDVIWTGSDDGYVHVTINGGNTWTDVSSGLPVRWVTSIRADANYPNKAYVTLSGFRWGESLSQVFRTDDFGQTWTSIGDGIPDGPANDILIDPADDQRYFVATDFGVYRTDDAGNSWFRFGSGLPNVVVNDLSFLASTRELFAGTYGRSIFSTVVPEMTVTPDDNKLSDGVVIGGSFQNIFISDDVYYKFDPSPTQNPQKQIVGFITQTASPVSDPDIFQFRLQTAMSGGAPGDVIQEIRLFNYDTQTFEIIDTRAATNEDSVVLARPQGNLSRFVQPITNEITAELKWMSPDFSGSTFTWDIAIDEAVWLIQ